MNNYNDEDKNKETKRRIIMVIIIIIIILLLISSCSCSRNFWGKIGDLFTNEKDIPLDENGEEEIILNRELQFDTKELNIYLSDTDGKLSFHYENISPNNFTCYTSDSSLATCYVEKDYVVVKPKKSGTVDVYLEAKVNGKKYQAKAKVIINEPNKYIAFSSNKGTLILGSSIKVAYYLSGLDGDIKVTLSDNSIASVEVFDGLIIITAKKTGKTNITISIVSNGKTYQDTYELYVTTNNNNVANVSKNSDSKLKSLTSRVVEIPFKSDVQKYYLGVDYKTTKIDFEAKLSSDKSKMKYQFNGKEVASLKDLELQVGENKLVITVEAEDGNVTTYEIIINREKEQNKSNTLLDLKVNGGEMSPSFNKDIHNYHVWVDSNKDKVSFDSKVENGGKVKYKYNGKEVNSLKDLEVKEDKNVLEIEIEKEDGSKEAYTVTIEREKSNDSYLKDIVISDGLKLNEQFDKNNKEYSLNVHYDKDKISLKGVLSDDRSTVSYWVDGKEVNPSDIELLPGDTEVLIVVESESKEKSIYKVKVHRSKITLVLDEDKVLYLNPNENDEFKIVYRLYEDDQLINIDKQKIKVDISGDYREKVLIEDGYIVIKPKLSMKDKTVTLKVSCGDYASDTMNITFKYLDYFVTPYKYYYDVNITSDDTNQSIILENNFFNGEVIMEETSYGIKIYEKDNPDVYIEVYFDKNELDILDVVGSSSLALQLNIKSLGSKQIKFKGYAKGKLINNFDVNLNVSDKYILVLDSNDGEFNEFTKEYRFMVDKNEEFDLKDYFEGYKKIDDCHYYDLVGFSLNKNDTKAMYDIRNSKIKVDKNTTLYAIYSKDITNEAIEEEKTVYLTDVDLFYNEEYYRLYNKAKVIYPGAHGAYIMRFSNNTAKQIEITSITLLEDTICIDNEGCLNMGYVIKDNPDNKYYFGNKGYEILRHDVVNTIDVPIKLYESEKAEVSLLWEWIDKNDKLDTLIGNYAGENINTMYGLAVGINYKVINDKCESGDNRP